MHHAPLVEREKDNLYGMMKPVISRYRMMRCLRQLVHHLAVKHESLIGCTVSKQARFPILQGSHIYLR